MTSCNRYKSSGWMHGHWAAVFSLTDFCVRDVLRRSNTYNRQCSGTKILKRLGQDAGQSSTFRSINDNQKNYNVANPQFLEMQRWRQRGFQSARITPAARPRRRYISTASLLTSLVGEAGSSPKCITFVLVQLA